MSPISSNTDLILLTLPMFAALLIAVFKLDTLLSQSPNVPRRVGRQLSGWDAQGKPMCVEPDGRVRGVHPRIISQGKKLRPTSRVTVEWVRD